MDQQKKKFKLLKAIIFLFFLGPVIAFAISGACSNHGGVNCSAGVGAHGGAICNDGYESSTSYYVTDECIAVNKTPCISPTKNYCTSTSDYTAHCGQPELGSIYTSCIADCPNQIDTYQSQLQAYNTCLTQQQQTNLQNQQQQLIQSIQQTNTNSCTQQHGQYSVYDQTK